MPANDTTALKSVLGEAHRFWFGALKSPEDRNPDKAAIWFRRSDAVDRQIAETFDVHIQPAAETDWDLAKLTREQAVGLVVMLDQFPRNIFRTTGEAFAFDPLARDIARRLIEGGIDRFYFVERGFLYLPFMHSENIADQDYGVFAYARDAVTVPESLRESFRGGLDFATRHRDIIRKFGRFPHRNAVLGRISTEAEIAFMSEKGRGF